MDRRKFLLAGAGGALGSMVSLNSGCTEKPVSEVSPTPSCQEEQTAGIL